MSWTDAFPYLNDDLISEYEEHATPDERAEFEEWFGIRKVMNRQAGKKHIVSITLFWKHVNADHPDMATPNRTRLLHSRRLGLVKRFDPYESYVEPLLTFGPELTKAHPEVCFRVHLAADLEFLAKDLIAAGYEIRLMKGSSIRYCPGGFWRFLALENRGKLVTVMDSDRIRFAPGEIARTQAMADSGLSLWRVPGYYNSEIRGTVRYRPLLGGHFGAKGGVPVRKWIEAFVWHTLRGTMPNTAEVPGCGQVPIHCTVWPAYGFDEWWQLAIYPMLAARGVLTFIPTDARSQLMPLDIEFASWAHPRSEVVYFSVGGRCC